MTITCDSAIVHAASLCRVTDHGGPRRGRSQGEINLIEDGAVAIRDGKIVDIGPTAELSSRVNLDAAKVFDASGMTVLPGLVEAHSHPVFAGSRYHEFARRLSGASLDEIVANGGGIWNSVLQTRKAPDEMLRARLGVAFRKMLADGITTVEAKSGYGLTTAQELRSLAIIEEEADQSPLTVIPTFLGAHVVPEGMNTDAYVREICEQMLPAIAEQSIARFCDITCEVGYFDQAQAMQMIRASERIGLPIRIHADAWKPSGGWALAAATGVHTADHVTFATDIEIEASQGTSTIAVLLPVAESVYMGDRRANARLLIEHDVPVAIATDYCSSIPVHSLRLSIGMAATWFSMTPGEAIVGATLNGAYAAGCASSVGSLDPGKQADILVLDCEHPYQFVWELGQTSVRRVYKGGKVVVGE